MAATVAHTYSDTIRVLHETCSKIVMPFFESCKDKDGRCDSAVKEDDVLDKIALYLSENHPTVVFEKQPQPRWWWDFRINGIPFNLKLTSCKSYDNAFNKTALYYSIVGKEPTKTPGAYNDLWKKLKSIKCKDCRDKTTEYHYLSVDKRNGNALIRSLFDVVHIKGNPSNDLQVHWGKEFGVKDRDIPEITHKECVAKVIGILQEALLKKINTIKLFAEGDIDDIFKSPE